MWFMLVRSRWRRITTVVSGCTEARFAAQAREPAAGVERTRSFDFSKEPGGAACATVPPARLNPHVPGAGCNVSTTRCQRSVRPGPNNRRQKQPIGRRTIGAGGNELATRKGQSSHGIQERRNLSRRSDLQPEGLRGHDQALRRQHRLTDHLRAGRSGPPKNWETSCQGGSRRLQTSDHRPRYIDAGQTVVTFTVTGTHDGPLTIPRHR